MLRINRELEQLENDKSRGGIRSGPLSDRVKGPNEHVEIGEALAVNGEVVADLTNQ